MIKGQYSDGKTSQMTDVVLYADDAGRIGIQGSHKAAIALSSVRISPRIGNTARYIEFPDGGMFETSNNNAVDELESRLQKRGINSLIHRFESSKRLVAITLLTVSLGAWAFVQFGIPHFSREVAMMLTDEQVSYLGVDVLKTMDEHLLEPSELSQERQDELQAIFQSILESIHADNIRLEFRKGGAIGANAFALPDGTIVFMDELVELADDNDEIVSIMLHEIGHVQYRHSLRMAIQGFSLAIVITMITGDVSASSSIVTSLPAVMIESGYSRDMETEADTYSLVYMLNHDINPIHFATIMGKLEASQDPEFKSCLEEDGVVSDCLSKAMQANEGEEGDEGSMTGYFSSHPGTAERIRRFEEAAQ
ncbi:hypothetical protein MNBD_GAMMA15-831 [hydrothermal vent metagenome]|uniref:Uncharacterized protein n=1 Tax=hydrothermal vent metagenome TaxID=652676 RepID=A0A3B0Y1Y6_9ZZZZ